MLKTEWKKLWLYQRGAVILLTSLLVYAALCLFSGSDSAKAGTQDEAELQSEAGMQDEEELQSEAELQDEAELRKEAAYLAYMERWKGELNDQKEAELRAEYDALNHADGQETQERKAAFMEIYNQYYYAKKAPSRRFLMDERGWNILLTRDSANLPLVLCLLALCVPVFCSEYGSRMEALLRSCKNGRERLAKDKLLVMALTAVTVTLLFECVQFGIVKMTAGLSGSSYPLQSLSFFEASPWLLTIGQAYGIVVLCRAFGAAWLAVLTAFFSVWCQKTELTVFAGLSVSLLPHLLGSGSLKYVLLLPAGMLAGTGYLWGTLTEPRYNDDYTEIHDVVTFRGVSPKEFCVLAGAFAVIFLLLLFFTVRRYVGRRK